MPETHIKITTGEFQGLMLLEGQRIRFKVQVHQFGVDAEFEKLLPEDPEVDVWTAYRALEKWVDDNMRG